MVATTAIQDVAAVGVVADRGNVNDKDNDIAKLLERIEQCIKDDNEEKQQLSSAAANNNSNSDDWLRLYWERAIGMNDRAAEAMDIYQNMVQDTPNLHRILVARKFDLNLSANLFLEQVRFRTKWKPLQITPDAIPTALPSGAWRLCGYSREGCVVSNYKLQHWNPNDYGAAAEQEQIINDDDNESSNAAIDEYTRYICYMIELMIGSMKKEEQFCVLFDLQGFSVSLVFNSNVRLMIRKLIYVAQAQYPERLRKVMLVNAPYGFSTAWKLIRPLLDEKTASKVHFCSLEQIQKDIDPSVLSVEYGGTHEEYPIPSKTLQEEIAKHKP